MTPTVPPSHAARRTLPSSVRVLLGSLTALCVLALHVTPAAARVATLTFVGIGQVTSVGGTFLANGFLVNDVVDMTIQIEETTADSNGSATAGTFNDPASVTTFIRQADPADTVSFTGFGFEMADSSRLDQASMPIAAEGTYWVSGALRDWDLHNINLPISDVNSLFTILRELPNAAIGSVSADGFAIDAPAGMGANVTTFTSLTPVITLTLGCGNGVVDPGETCDDPVCCDSTCDNALPNGTSCRPAAGPCDVAEVCSAGACPADELSPAGTVCNPSLGDCDLAEECTGASVDCPPDTLSQFTCGTICRPAQDACDTADFCDSFANSNNFDCPGAVTLCTPTATATATATPTATETPTATATRVPEGGACVITGDCETGLACVDGTCTDVTVPAPAMSKTGLLIALAILLFGGYSVLGRRRKAR